MSTFLEIAQWVLILYLIITKYSNFDYLKLELERRIHKNVVVGWQLTLWAMHEYGGHAIFSKGFNFRKES